MKNLKFIIFVLIICAVLVLVYYQPTNLKPTPEIPIHIPTPIPPITKKENNPPSIKTVVEKPGEIIGTEINYENIFNGVNKIRYGLGLPILKRSASLDAIAQARLTDMQTYNYFAHDNPTTGKKFYNWFNQPKDIEWSYTDENLACIKKVYYTENGKVEHCDNSSDTYFLGVKELINAWINSPTHYAVITKPEITYTGIAISGDIVVQEFGGFVK